MSNSNFSNKIQCLRNVFGFFCILLDRTWFNVIRFGPDPFQPMNSGDALHCSAKWIVNNELIHSPLFTCNVNSEYKKMQHMKKKEKEKGKSNEDERVVLEFFCNSFVVVWQEMRKGNRGEQGWKFRKWQDFFRFEQWRPLGLFWEIFAMINYLHCRWRREENMPSRKTNSNCFSKNWVPVSILDDTHNNKSAVNI